MNRNEHPSLMLDLSPYFNGELFTALGSYRNEDAVNLVVSEMKKKTSVEFDLRGVVRFLGGFPPSFNDSASIIKTGVPVIGKFSALHFLHGTMTVMSDRARLGSYFVQYDDGQSLEVSIRYGVDLRASPDVSIASGAVMAWTGETIRPAPGPGSLKRLYKTTWLNPRSDAQITNLLFIPEVALPSLFLIAVTGDTNSVKNIKAVVTSELNKDRANMISSIQRTPIVKPVADNSTVRNIPQRDPQCRPELIDLSRFYNMALTDDLQGGERGNDATALPKGLQVFGQVEFDTRGVVQLSGTEMLTYGRFTCPIQAKGIPVNRKAAKLHFLHGTGWTEPVGKKIGIYVLHYADGQTQELPIAYGEHLRNWWLYKQGDDAEPTQAAVVWTGENAAVRRSSGSLRLFLATYENPRPDVEIRSIDFVSTMTKCAPFLVGVTVE